MKANDLSSFIFNRVSNGAYNVTYTTPNRGDYWVARIEDMTIIDATKNADWAKCEDIMKLRSEVKRRGAHFSKNGERID